MSGSSAVVSRTVQRRGAIFWAACEAIIPSSGVTPDQREFMIGIFHRIVNETSPLVRWSLTVGLVALEYSSLFTPPRFARFSQQPLAGRTETLTRWSSSTLSIKRELMKGLIGLSMLGYYADARVFAALEYEPEQHKADMIRYRKDHYDLSIS